ncbi:MAG: polyribonucleotide nucleotidyltransferase [Bacteroidetes bacterium QH_2_67_10]|nr:MAG: polyribonucleotide nucleotidyltransferase [Bacteroidetes bacterium QH_2_67_10]
MHDTIDLTSSESEEESAASSNGAPTAVPGAGPEATVETVEFTEGRELSMETGRLAKQANGAVMVRQGETMVLCTATLDDEPNEGKHFFPLTVDYREKFASAGKIPGGFIKREGRPTDKETLTARLVDRAIRPLFPDGFYNSTHVVCFVYSADDEHDADVLAGLGASAALLKAGAPYDGPFAEVRVGRVDGEVIVNPTFEQREQSDLDLVVAGKEDELTMVEGEMDEISEEEMVDALDTAHESIKKLCRAQEQFVEKAGGPGEYEYETFTTPDALVDQVRDAAWDRMEDHIRSDYEKDQFYDGVSQIKDEVADEMLGEADETDEGYTRDQIRDAVGDIESEVLRELILSEGERLDGRGPEDVRSIWTEAGYLPRVHGSALFTRGETQVLGSVAMGTSQDMQPVDEVFEDEDKPFFLHYRFPPFCVGEAGFLRGPKRREIGHGMLAERALDPVVPSQEEFPYTMRLNAEVLESNGSSSMASVCASTMAMMDAGVPIERPVAGVAMGLVSDGERTQILTDILGTEDHVGDMDFKLTGTREGITACQMDIKIAGLPRELMLKALNRARSAREHILGKMEETIGAPRDEMSPYAPRLTRITIDADHIGDVIGPGGKVIKGLQSETNTEITVNDEGGVGEVIVAATNQRDAQAALDKIKQIVAEPEEGTIYEGTVRKIVGFGAFVEIMPGKDGLLHISEIDHGYVEEVEDYLSVGDRIEVKLLEVRGDGKLRLSLKPLLDGEGQS